MAYSLNRPHINKLERIVSSVLLDVPTSLPTFLLDLPFFLPIITARVCSAMGIGSCSGMQTGISGQLEVGLLYYLFMARARWATGNHSRELCTEIKVSVIFRSSGRIGAQMYQLIKNIMGSEIYDRTGDSQLSPELYMDLPAWGYGVYQLIQKV